MTLLVAQPLEQPQPLRFTREKYYHLGDLGFFEGRRVELIEGEILEMAPMKDLHAVAMGIVARRLGQVFPDGWVRDQLPLSLINDTEPHPDFAIVPGDPRDYKGKPHPHSAMLVVEVADATLRYDRTTKAGLYARAGIADYWIINLNDGCLEIMREPVVDATAPLGFRYRSVITLRAGQQVSPLAKPDASISVADLLP